MPYTVQPLPFKPNRLDGLTVRLLESHYENNYGGAVRRLNAIETCLADIDWAAAAGFDINGLKREALIAAGSMILHEVYFDALGGPGSDPQDETLAAAIERDFGSLSRWHAEFVAMGKALGGGSGWVLLAWCERLGRLVNQWGADHAHNLPSGVPLLALDMYEHAYHLDFGSNAGAYVETFMRNLHWERVAARYRQAVAPPLDVAEAAAAYQVNAEGLRTMRQQAGRPLLVLDVRLQDDYEQGRDQLPDARWRDPMRVEEWGGGLRPEEPIVVYCKYGGWVSQDTAKALRQKGLEVYELSGGISAWRAMGQPTAPLESIKLTS